MSNVLFAPINVNFRLHQILTIIALTFLGFSASAQFRYDITATPDSATVFVNGREYCATPCRVKFYWHQNKDGRMAFAVQAPGYEPWSDTLTSKPNKFDFRKNVILDHTPPKHHLDSNTDMVGFDKLAVRFEDNAPIGTYTNKRGDIETLSWGRQFKAGEAEFREKFYSVLNSLGFRTPVDDRVELFTDSEDKTRLPRYVVGVRITGIKADLKNAAGIGNSREIKGRTTIDLEWKVLDKKTDQIVLTYSNQGVAMYRQPSYNTNSDNLMAFENGLYDFLRKTAFYDLVNDVASDED